jgi:hypothetical protein
LTLVATVMLIAAYFSPIWWVSLTAPNYPKDAFPDGIRIHFHFNGVFNGCTAVGKGTRMGSETLQADLGAHTGATTRSSRRTRTSTRTRRASTACTR